MNDPVPLMQRALYLAQSGAGNVAPNPLVGAVLVHEGKIIGEGWHRQYGQAHAEVACINSVQPGDQYKIPESTMYVTLEPCAHFGKTPPCSALIIRHKIPKVVIACVDTFSEVAGKGIRQLRDAGISVELGILEQEARWLNRRFFTFHEKKRPYVILKWAESSDGFIAPENGRKVMLSNTLVQRYVHKMRHEEAAILVGYNTALADDPFLTDRFFGTRQPLRVIYDRDNALPDQLQLKTDGHKTIIYNHKQAAVNGNCSYIRLEQPVTDPATAILADLHQRGINSLIVEGGTKTLTSFIGSGLWDEAHIIKTPVAIGSGIKAPHLSGGKRTDRITLEDNTVELFENILTQHLP
ncbi:MAG: bifunctional diaminohydroxyphosphoribosylaminopyrimidine deaminase/5-amino-6-(5-phosphoribosylamino)uracil reductase RibD [Sphingobacteriales bacterium]|nr:MAG: bifunctional diaminohydroxyphosphoribosylaminopyrimidine deaminase/5-amino-6-(5-phosphoribosylamino)uracil reductase RibD [Sphingobacteriales bacterium]